MREPPPEDDPADAGAASHLHEPEPAPARTGTIRATLIGFTLAGALAGGVLAYAWPGSYVATSEMLLAETAAGTVDNQMRLIGSRTMLDAVAERLNLAADAEFNGGSGMIAGLGDLLSGDGAATADQRRRSAVENLSRAVEVARAGSGSVIAVSAASADPQKAALIANTLADLFVENAGSQPGAAPQRVAELREAVAEAERAVEAFKAENELVDAQGRLITDDEIVRLGEQLSGARARTVELNARAASTREANIDSIVTGSLPEQYASPALAGLRARHAEAKQQLDRLAARLGPRHPERLAAEAELEGARQEIAAELRRVASSLQTELRRAVQQEQDLAGELARMKVRQGDIGEELVRLRELERDAELKRSAYERALAATQAGATAPGAASVISRAQPPLGASAPSVTAFSLAGALAGLLAGASFAGWRRREPAGDDAPLVEYDDDAQAPDTSSHAAGKDDSAMHPYHPYYAPQPDAAPQAEAGWPQQQHHAAPVHQPAMAPQAPQSAPQAFYPQPQPYPYPAPPQAYWQPVHAHQPPHAFAPQPMPQQPWQPYAYAPPMQPMAYAPAPQHQHQAAYAPPAEPAPRPHREDERRRAQEAFIDERTNAAIEEIRQSLREFREAIEDFADERDRRADHRRYGT